MDEAQSWSIIEAGYVADDAGTSRDWLEALKRELLKLPAEKIVGFGHWFNEKVGVAYTIDVWGAAYLINGGCSDDGFHYFRCWLVGMGREVFEKAVADPDSLADVLTGEWPYEASLDVAANRAWTEKTGRTDDEFYAELDKLPSSPEVDEGEDWDFDDDAEVRRRMPRLWKLYSNSEEDEGDESNGAVRD